MQVYQNMYSNCLQFIRLFKHLLLGINKRIHFSKIIKELKAKLRNN